MITPTLDCADTLADCLDSVASQLFVDCEHIVIDGVSTDGTVAVLKAHLGQLSRFVSEPDWGVYDALNKGLAYATGDILGFLHGDDVFAGPNTLARIAGVFNDPSVDAVYGDLVYVNRKNPSRVIRYWRAGEYRPELLRRGWMPPHPTLYVRRRIYETLGLFDLKYRIASDYDLMLRLLTKMDGKLVYIPEVLVRMRIGGLSNRSLTQILRKSREDYWVLRANQLGGLRVLIWKNLAKLGQFFPRA